MSAKPELGLIFTTAPIENSFIVKYFENCEIRCQSQLKLDMKPPMAFDWQLAP